MKLGLVIGGASRRMGGSPKALLTLHSSETILSRTLSIAAELSLEPLFLGWNLSVHQAAPHVQLLRDDPRVQGPLAALFTAAHALNDTHILLLATDMPFVSAALLRRLATESLDARVLAPRSPTDRTRWEPLCARYALEPLRPALNAFVAEGGSSFQRFFDRISPTELVLSVEEQRSLTDWDTPEDRRRTEPRDP